MATSLSGLLTTPTVNGSGGLIVLSGEEDHNMDCECGYYAFGLRILTLVRIYSSYLALSGEYLLMLDFGMDMVPPRRVSF
jgi:hypothetical protein